ncbi:MAG: HAMP domain-containing protein, partial [Chloroflexota bacterium]
MNLRRKVALILGVIVIVLVAILYTTSRAIILGSFLDLEKESTQRDVERVRAAVEDDLSKLNILDGDWAAWNDTYEFIVDQNQEYIDANLMPDTLINLRLNIILYLDAESQVVFSKGIDLESEEETPLPQSLVIGLTPSNPLLKHSNPRDSVEGIILLPEGPLLVASHPIVTSEYEGPIRGALIMARYLTPSEVNRLAGLTHMALSFSLYDDPQLDPDFLTAKSSITGDQPVYIKPVDSETVAGYTLFEDIYGDPALILRVMIPRDIYSHGQASITYFFWALIAVGLLLGSLTILLLERFVLSRLAKLNKDVNEIGASGELSAQVSTQGNDEISGLAREINRMLESLDNTEQA